MCVDHNATPPMHQLYYPLPFTQLKMCTLNTIIWYEVNTFVQSN